MDAKTEQIIASTIEYIIKLVWEGVAVNTIANKLTIIATHQQVFQFILSYTQNAIQNRQVLIGIASQSDPTTIPIDNLAYGQMPKQTITKIQNQRKGSITSSINQTRSRRFTMQSFQQKKSPQKASNTGASALITLPQQKDYQIDLQQDKYRSIVLRNEAEQRQLKRFMENRQKQRLQSDSKNKKIMKDLKKYTYDYEGKFFGIGNVESTQYKMLKMNKKQTQQKVISKDMKNPQQKSIINEKIKQRETRNNKQFIKEDKNIPQFDQNRPDSLLDLFQQNNKLSEGIKLVGQKGKDKVIKQKPRRKLSGMKKYRLNEYQNMIKDKKFKDFKKQVYKYQSKTIDINSTLQLTNQKSLQAVHPQQQTISSNSEISLVLNKKKNEQLNNILPPIQSNYLMTTKKLGLGFKKLITGYPETSRSYLQQSGSSTRRSHKSQIKIDHQQLYFENFSIQNKIK